MKCKLVEFDDKHYASNVSQSDMTLKWNALGNTHNLIVRGAYGSNIVFSETERSALERVPNEQLFSGKEIRYDENRYLTFFPKGYVNNYQITACPAAYAVFCCSYEQETDTCTLFVPNDACLYQCNVASQIEVHISLEPVKKSFFSRKPAKTYYSVSIPMIPGYVDGSLQYRFDGCKYRYPITKAMLGKSVSIPAYEGRPPQIDAAIGNGYKITIR